MKAVETNYSGKYSCEVSADAPSFHTIIVSGDMEVVVQPTDRSGKFTLSTAASEIPGVASEYKLMILPPFTQTISTLLFRDGEGFNDDTRRTPWCANAMTGLANALRCSSLDAVQ
uniref:Ig-like domain-containing protein n=1 Tax=Anopheles culicifacies TaxID=139723 RepID=A0A182MA10_9DIPT